MQSSRCLYSLPKTQPTLSSSSKGKLQSSNKFVYSNIQTCPQVNAFIIDDKDSKYTHNMRIDYGKLEKPYKDNLKKGIQKEVELSHDLNLLLSTKKFNILKHFALNQFQKDSIQPPIHALLTQKKPFSAGTLTKSINPQSSEKKTKKNRIISVKAYEMANKSIDVNKDKNQQKQPQMQQQRTQRKISHSRIIKTFNPTAGIQTKIITYPDLSEVIKIRESRRK